VLELTLPEKIELLQLVEQAGQYLGLDCLYEAEKIGNQMITLKLHSRQRSEMRVKDLYTLLQTVLKIKGLVMTRLEGNLVSIVPAAEAMEIDPQFIDPNSGAIQAGDVVVTRIFELQNVDVAGVTGLLQNMKLTLAVSPIPETQTLFVTCYAHRMARIEQLVEMVDRPGKPREFRFRQLRHTMAATLTHKILALAGELEGMAISIGSAPSAPPARSSQAASPPVRPAATTAVYLDTDDRTNRLLMIGPCEQLETVEGLIDALDVPEQDLRTLHVYEIQQTTAQAAMEKIKQLGIIEASGQTARTAKAPGAPGTTESAPQQEAQVVLLEATNSLLVHATAPQHAQMRMVLDYIDVAPQDTRVMRVYRIRHVDVEDVARKLQQFELSGQTIPAAAPARASGSGVAAATPAMMTTMAAATGMTIPQVVVLEVTNSLMINAAPEQHQRIESILRYVDVEAPKAAVPYEIYFLENQDPEQLAQVLGKLIQETVLSADGKVEKTIARTEEQITIIPDKNTFSLIVHASRKNQDWIATLVEKLDKRRPQVLIDVTLVEITETEVFNYDLNLIASAPNLTQTSGLTGTLVPGANPITSDDIMDRLASSGRSQFADFQSDGGELNAFYGDRHINLLLQAMQSKNYGRVLAKPKILVNDNEPGTIKTTDTTYVTKRSSIPVGSGAAGNDVTLIETAINYEPYEAGITLDITPHISQGELLRMEIELTRSDFRETEDTQKPPDQTASELKTTVFVPDGSTIILGGLLRLNQNKGGTKVPILGDIPLVGGLFRTINNRDLQSKLYIFVKAEIIRPAGTLGQEMGQLETLSERNRQAFEKHEQEFQGYQSWPGIKSKPIDPPRVLEAR
jgi:type II secretory pathway component GspD/PulD (secretin)